MSNKDKKGLLLYHANCPDGFGARFVFELKYGDNFDYLPLSHSQEPFFGLSESDIKDRNIVMLDISFRREDALRANQLARSFRVIDHHVSAMKQLEGLDFCHFDMNHSGAILAWRELNPGVEAPLLLQYVQDRDLWKFELPHTEEVLSVLDSQGYSFDSWRLLSDSISTPEGLQKVIGEGKAILVYKDNLIDSLVKRSFHLVLKGYCVPAINTAFFKSEIGSLLSRNQPFAVAYDYNGTDYSVSLRSSKEFTGSVDVSKIAEMFGGGGHKNAAGFSVKSLDELS